VLRTVAALALAAATPLATGGCSDDEPDDPADALADRVTTILEDDGSAVLERLAEGGIGIDDADLAEADVLCPRVTDPEVGDRATCRVTAGGVELELDVEFENDGALEVVQVAVAP
jgi:hypothetical protein